MVNSLIAAVDPDAGTDRAVLAARTLARRTRLPVEVIHVVPPRSTSTWAYERQIDADSGEVTTIVPGADVAAAIVELVQHRDGALLVLSTEAPSLVSRFRRSVTGDILSALRQPVLVLGPHVPRQVSLSAVTPRRHRRPRPRASTCAAVRRVVTTDRSASAAPGRRHRRHGGLAGRHDRERRGTRARRRRRRDARRSGRRIGRTRAARRRSRAGAAGPGGGAHRPVVRHDERPVGQRSLTLVLDDPPAHPTGASPRAGRPRRSPWLGAQQRRRSSPRAPAVRRWHRTSLRRRR